MTSTGKGVVLALALLNVWLSDARSIVQSTEIAEPRTTQLETDSDTVTEASVALQVASDYPLSSLDDNGSNEESATANSASLSTLNTSDGSGVFQQVTDENYGETQKAITSDYEGQTTVQMERKFVNFKTSGETSVTKEQSRRQIWPNTQRQQSPSTQQGTDPDDCVILIRQAKTRGETSLTKEKALRQIWPNTRPRRSQRTQQDTKSIACDILIGQAKNMQQYAKILHDFYCTQDKLEWYMNSSGMDCEEYSLTVDQQQFPSVSTILPSFDNSDEHYHNITNEIRRGLHAYLHVGENISNFEEYHACKGDPGCTGELLCCHKPENDPFYCNFSAMMVDTTYATKQLLYLLEDGMVNKSIPLDELETIELPEPEKIDDQLPHYSLGGIFNILRQADASLEGFNTLCGFDTQLLGNDPAVS